MMRTECLAVMLAFFVAAGRMAEPVRASEPESDDRPNFVLLLADDMGYADPSCFGGKAVPTPHLDRLAESGIKLSQFYAGSAVCTPTRASVLTGCYPLRFDIRRQPGRAVRRGVRPDRDDEPAG